MKSRNPYIQPRKVLEEKPRMMDPWKRETIIPDIFYIYHSCKVVII